MRKSLLLCFSLLFILTACNFEIDEIYKEDITVSYAFIEAGIDVNVYAFSELSFESYQDQKLDFQNSNKIVVMRFIHNNPESIDNDLVLAVGFKYFNEVDYVTEDKDGKQRLVEKLFRLIPTDNRIFSSEQFVFNFDRDLNKNHYVVLKSLINTAVAIELIDKDEYIKHDSHIVIFFTLLYSSLIALFLINVVYFLYVKNKAYLYYAVYVLSGIVAIYWQEGRMIDIPYFYLPVFGYDTKTIYFILSTLLVSLFIYKFLNLQWRKQLSGKLLVGWTFYLGLLFIVAVALSLLNLDSRIISYLYNYTIHIGNILILVIAFIHYRKGNRQAGFLLYSWIALIILSSFRIVFVLNPGPNQFWMQHSYEIALVVEAIILGLGLADQALGFKKSRDIAQAKYSKVNKALFAETLINNFLYEIKEEILNDNQVHNFIKQIESKFAEMIMKFAPIDNITRLSYKSGICQKHTLSSKKTLSFFHAFFESNNDDIETSCESDVVFSKVLQMPEEKYNIQIIGVPVSSSYSSEYIDYECLILEVKPNYFLEPDEIARLKEFIEKSLKALIDSKELKQITKHAQNVISDAEEKDKSIRIKDRFFANISHEFRTPLTLTISPLQDLQKQYEFLNTSGRYLVDTALTNAQELMNLVDKFLDVQKLESDKFPLRVTKVNLNKLIYSVIKKMVNWSLDHFQALTFNKIHEADVYVYCDKRETEKVLTNLVSNAIKYSGKNSKITLSVIQESSWIKVFITDDGIGIVEEIQEHIFERYYQAESTQHLSEAGTGIGLSYVKDVMKLHRGQVTLNSQEGQGSEFCLWFKSGFSHFDYNEISGSDEKFQIQDNQEFDDSKIDVALFNEGKYEDITTLLIVEDNKELRKYLAFKFETDYKVIKAKNGKIGMDKALKYLPDLIVSDIMMPEMDGVEMTESLRKTKECKTIPIILLTARSSHTDAIEGLQIGADDYVTKPFDFDELKARVDRLIESRKAIREDNPQYSSDDIEKTKSEFQDKLDEVIIVHMADKSLNVEKLAEILFLDRSSLYRKIKSELEMSPISYIRKVRMDYAVNLLKNKKLTVSETAYACGFDSLSYFSKQFKKTHGISPSDII